MDDRPPRRVRAATKYKMGVEKDLLTTRNMNGTLASLPHRQLIAISNSHSWQRIKGYGVIDELHVLRNKISWLCSVVLYLVAGEPRYRAVAVRALFSR